MEEKTIRLRSGSQIFCETKEHTVENEMLLPDYYPEIGRIVSCSVVPATESVAMNGDRLSVAGNARIRLLYTDGDSRPVCAEQTVKYTKVVACCETQDGDAVSAQQSLVAVRYKASGPRKLEVRLTLAVKCRIFRTEEISLLSELSGSDVASVSVPVGGFVQDAYSESLRDFSSTLTLPVAREQIAAVVCETIRFYPGEVSATTNKALVRGNVQLAFSLLTKDGGVYRDLRYHIPFTEIFDVYGAKEDSQIFCSIRPLGLRVDPTVAQGDEKEAEAVVSFQAVILCGAEMHASCVSDAFSLCGEAEVSRGTIRISDCPKPVSVRQDCQFTAELSEQLTELIGCSCGEATLIAGEDGRTSFCAEVQILYLNADRALRNVTRRITADCGLPSESLSGMGFLSVALGDLRADASGSAIRCEGTFFAEGFTCDTHTYDLVTQIAAEPARGTEPEKLTLYYADAGESVWNIAKTFRTSPAQLSEAPVEADTVLSDNKLLVFYA